MEKINYQNGKIYCIRNYVDDDCYIGHTTQTLKRRFQKHKDNSKIEKVNQRKLYVKMTEMGLEHFYIEEMEKYPCNSLEELEARERHYILERQPVLNVQIPQKTMEEWKQDRKEHLKEYERQRHQNNPRKEYKPQYREEKKDELNEYNRQYRANNPELFKKYQEQSKKKNDCECGTTVSRGSLSRHIQSQHHQNYLKNNQDNNVQIQESKCQDRQ